MAVKRRNLSLFQVENTGFGRDKSHISATMSATGAIPFRKMNGLGNDFVVLDARAHALRLRDDQARAIADRKSGIGCDQVIMLEPSKSADVRMRIWNNEGFEVESCGNASRCIADLLFAEKRAERVTIDTKGGYLVCRRAGEGLVTVDNGVPKFDWKDIPLSETFADTRHIELQVGPIDAPLIHSPSVINVGNPHCIFWVKDLDVVDLAKVGPMIEFHPLFPAARQCHARPRRRSPSHHHQGVGTRRRPDARLWHGGLRGCGGGGAPAAHRPARHGHASGRRSLSRMARERRSHPDDRSRFIRIRRRVAISSHGRCMSEARIVTFGCRLNVFESEVMRGKIDESGLKDAIVFNTCAVTAEATRQARQAIRKARRDNPEARIIVTGCAAQIDPQSFAANERSRSGPRQ